MSRIASVDNISLSTFPAISHGVKQKISLGASSVQSNTVQVTTTVVRLISDRDCFFDIGPSADASSGAGNQILLAASRAEYFSVIPGTDKIAAIQSAGGGNLYILEGG